MAYIKKMAILLLVSAVSLAALGCVSVSFSPQPGAARKAVGAFKNNGTATLSAGLYQGGFTVNANSVTLTGQGIGITVIDGDLRIDGNNCVVRNVSVRGDVYINGNNADLSGAKIEGRVFASGKGNRW